MALSEWRIEYIYPQLTFCHLIVFALHFSALICAINHIYVCPPYSRPIIHRAVDLYQQKAVGTHMRKYMEVYTGRPLHCGSQSLRAVAVGTGARPQSVNQVLIRNAQVVKFAGYR